MILFQIKLLYEYFMLLFQTKLLYEYFMMLFQTKLVYKYFFLLKLSQAKLDYEYLTFWFYSKPHCLWVLIDTIPNQTTLWAPEFMIRFQTNCDFDLVSFLYFCRFYLGRGNVDMTAATYAEATYDELEVWYADRDYLIAHGYIQRGKWE